VASYVERDLSDTHAVSVEENPYEHVNIEDEILAASIPDLQINESINEPRSATILQDYYSLSNKENEVQF
jgi:hypothetical protein